MLAHASSQATLNTYSQVLLERQAQSTAAMEADFGDHEPRTREARTREDPHLGEHFHAQNYVRLTLLAWC